MLIIETRRSGTIATYLYDKRLRSAGMRFEVHDGIERDHTCLQGAREGAAIEL